MGTYQRSGAPWPILHWESYQNCWCKTNWWG